MSDEIERETFVTENADGSISLDAYAGMSREKLKDHCLELCMALDEWKFAAMAAATDGDNTLENIREPHRSKISQMIKAYSDEDEEP